MATVRIINNILENDVKEFSVEKGISVGDIIKEHTDGDIYSGVLVECYDAETGKTFFAPIEEDDGKLNALVQVHGKDAPLDYVVEENDIVGIVITPYGGDVSFGWDWGWSWWGAIGGALSGALTGAMLGNAILPGWGALIGAGIGMVVGFVAGGIVAGSLTVEVNTPDSSSSSGIDSDSLPDVRGSANQPLTDNCYPLVIGKHLATPFILGSTWNEISGTHGETNYIHALYAVAYAPLRITDLKLGEILLAHNQPWAKNENLKNIFHGALHGTDTSATSSKDEGEIVNTWSQNDITIEILQQDQNGGPVDYGSIYPYAKIQEDVSANCLYILDESVGTSGNISYKGVSLKNGLRNNHVQFSEQYPASVKVELDFSQGLYKTRSETNDGNSEVKYYRIPMWVAIQWRVYSEDNDDVTGDDAGVISLPAWNTETESYDKIDGRVKRGWNTFSTVNGISVSKYTAHNRSLDADAHTGQTITHVVSKTVTETITHKQTITFISSYGVVKKNDIFLYYNDFKYYSGERFAIVNNKNLYKITNVTHSLYGSRGQIKMYVTLSYSETVTRQTGSDTANFNNGWLDQQVFNLQSLGGTNSDEDGISEFRCISEVDLVDWARNNLMTADDSEETFIKKFKSYFYDAANTSKCIEVRVVRVSPCYLDEAKSTKDHSAYKFSDIFSWSTLTSTMYDGDSLIKDNAFVLKRPLTEERMRKLCLIAIKAKTDTTDQLTNSLKKFTCTAQSFAPYYDDEQKKWFPLVVQKEELFTKPDGSRISKTQFEKDRQDGIKSERTSNGNDFIKNMVNTVIRTAEHMDSSGRYYIPNDDTLRYCNNNVASMFLLMGIGAHLGKDALSYTQADYETYGLGDFNMLELAKWYKWAEDVTDGSTYPSKGWHINHDGESIQHEAGDEVHIYFTANAYVYQAQTLENLFSAVATAGRAIYTRDLKNRITIVIDKPEQYPVALINQQNTLKSSYTISFAELPSGILMNFSDENDGYNTNSVYCMCGDEDPANPRKAIESYSIPMVTNNYQLWSLGRYVLANRILQKEVVVKQIGMEGHSIGLGNLVVVQDDTMLLGTDTGGRITKLIEDTGHIYGFIINNTYKYTGELEEYEDSQEQTQTRCKQGVIVMQPTQYKESKVITLRLGKPGTSRTVDGVQYKMVKGDTNLVLFENVISKTSTVTDGSYVYAYRPEVDNIVGFGIVGNMSALYRVVRIKPDAKHNFELTLTKYQEDLYNYGKELPSFQNNMTIPDRSEEDAFNLSNNATQADLVKAIAEANKMAKDQIDDTFSDEPDIPENFTADVKRDCIQFQCEVASDKVNTIDHIVYEITKPDGSVVELDGSYSTEYYFNRETDGYPEKEELYEWTFRAKAVSFYLSEYGTPIESEWTNPTGISETSLAEYGTWKPAVPQITGFTAEENGITAVWTCDNSNVYGTVEFEVKFYYDNTLRETQNNTTMGATYQFNRSVDGYPEKPETEGITTSTLTLDNYSVVVKAINRESYKATTGEEYFCNYSKYKTWIPSKPTVTSRVVSRNVTLILSQANDIYGTAAYLVGVRRYDDDSETFYVPDLATNPYSRETAYKLYENGKFVIGKAESDYVFTQTMPLESQGGSEGVIDVNESKSDDRYLSINNNGENKLLAVGIGGKNPIDTSYQFEVYAYNKTVEDFYDSIGTVHNYDITTYHKVSTAYERKTVIALATSIMDVLNGSIVNDKVAENAISAEKIYTYNLVTLTEGVHSLSGFAYDALNDTKIAQLVSEIRNGHNRPTDTNYDTALDELDGIIKANSTNFWIGLDTDHPEFYMGNDVVAHKNLESTDYFHYYYDKQNNETNLDIKLTNFILTAISSTIKGFFNVRNKRGEIKDKQNSFLQVNPEQAQNDSFGLAGETLQVKGDVKIEGGQFDEGKGNLTVGKNVRVGNDLKVSGTGIFKRTASGNNSPDLIVGGETSEAHLEMDSNSLTAKSDGATAAQLNLNKDGGLVKIGSGGLNVSGDTELGNLTIGSDDNAKTETLFGSLSVKDATGTQTAGISQSGVINGADVEASGNVKGDTIQFVGNDGTRAYFKITDITLSGTTLTITTGA